MCPKCVHTQNFALLKSIIIFYCIKHCRIRIREEIENLTYFCLLLAKLYAILSLYAKF